jgi:6-phosphogluconolactonase
MRHHFETLADASAVARIGPACVAEQARRAADSGGRFHFAVSGGHTPWAMFASAAMSKSATAEVFEL